MRAMFLAIAAAAAIFLSGTAAQAGVLTGTSSWSAVVDGTPGGTLDTARNVSGVTKTSGGFDFDDTTVPVGTTWGTFVIDQNPMSLFSITSAGFGTFTADTLVSDNTSGNNRTIEFEGAFDPGTLFPNTASITKGYFSISLLRSPALNSYSISITFDALGVPPTSAVPEPTSMAIFGLGALGLAARRFRRK